MGFLDRLHNVVTGTLGSLEAPLGAVKDTALSLEDVGNPGTMIDDWYHAFVDRTGQEMSSLAGPTGVGGSLIGAIPAGIRQPAAGVINPAQNAMDDAYTYLVGRPLTTAMTAASMASEKNAAGDWGKFLSPSTWSQAWDVSGHRSLGQSVALAVMTKDIENPTQVQKAQGTDFYHGLSGTFDAVARMTLDPTTIVAGGGTGYLHELHDVGNTQAAIDFAERTGANSDAANKIYQTATAAPNVHQAAANIRNLYFAHDYQGGQKASILAEHALDSNYGSAADVQRALRVMEGRVDDVAQIREELPQVHSQYQNLLQQRQQILDTPGGWAGSHTPEEMRQMENEINAVHNQEDILTRLQNQVGTLRTVPSASPLRTAQNAITGSDWYQASPYSKPLRMIFQHAPPNQVVLPSSAGDVALWNWLQQGDLPLARQQELRGMYLNAANDGEKYNVVNRAIDENLGSIADTTSTKLSPAKYADWLRHSPDVQADPALFDKHMQAYLDATGRDERLAAVNKASDELDMARPGMTTNEINQMLAESMTKRDLTYQIHDQRKYDGNDLAKVTLENEEGATQIIDHEHPLFETQLADKVHLPDLRLYRRATDQVGQWRLANPVSDLSEQIPQLFTQVWKPMNLLRPATAMRILTDSQLRIAAKVGALSAAKLIGGGAKQAAEDGAAGLLRKVGVDWEHAHTGVGNFLVNDYSMAGLYGLGPNDGAGIYKLLQSARGVFTRELANAEGGIYDALRASGDWRSVVPGDAMYGKAWTRDVNFQIGSSKLGQKLLGDKLAGASDDEAIRQAADWLDSTPEGQNLVRTVGRKDTTDWATRANEQVNNYLPTETLKKAALRLPDEEGNTIYATEKLLRDEYAAHPEQFANGGLPIVHGEVVQQDVNGGPIANFLKNTRDQLYKSLLDKPDEYLVRTPFMDTMYQGEVKRQVQLLTGQQEYGASERLVRHALGLDTGKASATGFSLTQADLERIQNNARQFALGQTRGLLHDFSERSMMAQQLRFVAPFYSAWQQVFTRWAGIAVENPAYMRRLDMIWRSPERAGLVTDGAGNVLDANDNIQTPVPGGPWKKGDKAADSRRNITLSLPTAAEHIPVLGDVLKGQGDQFRFNKDSLNMVLSGLPRLGPLAQIPLYEISKSDPTIQDSLKWAFPYGPPKSLASIYTPSLIRNIQSTEDSSDRSHAYNILRIYTDMSVDYARGLRDSAPTFAEAEKKAQAYWHLKTLAGYTLPVQTGYVSPYQMYIDAYHARQQYDGTLSPQQKADPNYQTPKEWFLGQFGREFFALTDSMSKSIDAVPPTAAGYKISQENKDFLGKHPELGALLVGSDGAGAFSQSVYNAQFQNQVYPGGPSERSVQDFQAYANAPDIALGWEYFSKGMDQLDALRIQRGLSNFNVHGAEDLQAMKKNLVYNLAQQYPGWFQEYASTDQTKWDQRINGMMQLVNLPNQQNRPEMQGLKQYLDARNQLTQTLAANAAQGGSSSLTAQKNRGTLADWDNYVQGLVAQNLAFAATYHRWLENDPVTVTPLTELAGQGMLVTPGQTAVTA